MNEIARLEHLLQSPEMFEYIEAHPNATPEEVLAHFGVPFDREVWNETIRDNPDTAREQRSNPADRRWGEER